MYLEVVIIVAVVVLVAAPAVVAYAIARMMDNETGVLELFPWSYLYRRRHA